MSNAMARNLARTVFHYADLARERERHLTTARAVQIPKYGQMTTAGRAE